MSWNFIISVNFSLTFLKFTVKVAKLAEKKKTSF